jgi:hypothetical protein
MRCPHCLVEFHDDWYQNPISYYSVFLKKSVITSKCPACKKYIVKFRHDTDNIDGRVSLVEPTRIGRKPVPSQVPLDISGDYVEACDVLHISPKASAALSRRCLQSILRSQGYKGKDLSKEIDAILAEPDPRKAIPSTLREVVDGIRNFGNFSAHPIDDKTTLQIIDVEPHEAEWCLEIIEEMFDHFYVRPAAAAAKKAALNQKLAAAGKPPAK